MANRVVCLFAGARGNSYLYGDSACIATGLVERGCDIIYGGSSKGVMGAICAAVKKAGGKITGVLPDKVYQLNHYDKDIETIVAETMAHRKQVFWDKSDAFLCLPGGVGTLDEVFEIWTLSKLGYINPIKPIVIYNENGFYNPLISMTDNMIRHGTMPEERAGLVQFVSTPWAAIDAVAK